MSALSLKRTNQVLVCIVLVCVVLYLAKKVLIPIAFAAFFAMLFVPFSNALERKKFSRGITAFLSVFILVIVGVGIILMIVSQGKKMAEKMPQMKERSKEILAKSEQFISEKTGIPEKQIHQKLVGQTKKFRQSSGTLIKKSFMGVADFLTAMVLVFLFMFLFLFQRDKYESFFLMYTNDAPTDRASSMLQKISAVSQHYLRGRALSVLIFTICFWIGFLIVGLENAFLLAFIAALLTIIPYVGSIIGGLFPFAVALVSGSSGTTALGALAVILVVQCIDNYFIEPYIIGGEVSISAFFTILILFIGGLLWGVAGMILFLPMLGVFKIICDHVPGLYPIGYLIGDQKDATKKNPIVEWFQKKFGRNSHQPSHHTGH